MKNKIILFIALFYQAIMFAQATPSSVLNQQTTEVKSSVAAITSWIMAIVGVVAFVQAVLIFTSSQGTGEEKIKKAGTWIFMIVFCALGFVIVKALFP